MFIRVLNYIFDIEKAQSILLSGRIIEIRSIDKDRVQIKAKNKVEAQKEFDKLEKIFVKTK
jgi:hypothetical protein